MGGGCQVERRTFEVVGDDDRVIAVKLLVAWRMARVATETTEGRRGMLKCSMGDFLALTYTRAKCSSRE